MVQITDLVAELPYVGAGRKVHEVPDPAGPSFHNTGHARLHLLDDDDGGRELGAVDELLHTRRVRRSTALDTPDCTFWTTTTAVENAGPWTISSTRGPSAPSTAMNARSHSGSPTGSSSP